MTTLRHALGLKPVHFISIIGRENGLGINSNLRKTDLIEKVAVALSTPANLSTRLSCLTPTEKQTLMDLLAAGGRLPARYLTSTYGPLRSPRQIIQAYRQKPPLGHLQQGAPLSPLEQLCILGLIFHDPQTNDLFIPEDFVPHLPAPELPPPAPAAPATGPAPIDLLCHDLTCLLALLQQDSVSPLHGRWLSPYFLKHWGQCCAIPPATPTARSELQTGRRRFLHYLAESAGLVNSNWLLVNDKKNQNPKVTSLPITNYQLPVTPTPTAWLWLNSTRHERLQSLWQAWSQPDLERWQRFRLPGAAWLADPARLLEPVQQALLKIDAADPALFAATLFRSQPHLVDLVPANMLNRDDILRETVVELLAGPLVWLGVLLEQGREENESLLPLRSPAHFQLTPQGYSLLSGQPLADDDTPSPSKFSITGDMQPDPPQSRLTLSLSGGLPEPADLMVALEVGSREYGVGGLKKTSPTSYSLLLTPSSFISALHRGWSPPALLDALNRLAERPLTGQETGLLRAWAGLARQIALGPVWLLETTEPGIITRLASTRRGRALIHRTLSPRAVVVDPAQLNNLVRRLTEQEGVPPQLSGGTEEQRSRGENLPNPKSKISKMPERVQNLKSNAAHLWLLLKVYQNLGQYIRLPVRIPQVVVDRLVEMLSPAEMAGADVAAEQTLATLRQALDGQTSFPPWPEDGLPVEKSLSVIEQAMATGQNLQLLYYAASTDRLTRRVVKPYRVQWHGGRGSMDAKRGGSIPVEVEEQRSRGAREQGRKNDGMNNDEQSKIVNPKSRIGYLIGFCHHAQAERMFRLDRIREIELVEL